MSFDKLTDFAITIVLAAALAGNLDLFTKWVYVARAKLLYESRTETWGSPYFFISGDKAHPNNWKQGRR